MKYPSKLLFIVLCTVTLFIGCGQRLPDGMPDLHFCEITLTQGNAPLSEADVVLASSDATYPWIISGQTNSSGKALMFTNGNYKGAPEGEFIVRISKMRLEEGKPINPNDPFSAFSPSYEIHFVEKPYRESATSPLKAKVEQGNNRLSFDVGKAVEEKVEIPNP